MREKLLQLCATLWTTAWQTPLSMRFSRQEYWRGLSCPSSGDLPDPGVKPTSLISPALADEFFTTSITWEAYSVLYGDLNGKEIQKERIYVYLLLLLLLSHFSRVRLYATP